MRIPAVIVLVALLVVGCWHGGLRTSYDKLLREVTRDYYNLLMWKYYDRCAGFIRGQDRASFVQFASRYGEDLNITSHKVEGIEYSPDKKEATVTVAVTYYFYPSVTEKRTVIKDRWKRQGRMWFLIEPSYGDIFAVESQ